MAIAETRVASPSIVRTRFAFGHPTAAALVVLAVLLTVAPQYGYHRDELYFRMLEPAWGYTDQPPLTPLIAEAAISLLGDSVVAIRVFPALCAAASLFLLALVAREAGGSARAQAFVAWGMAGATMTMLFGHVLLTASLDLVVWPAVLLFAMRAVLRGEGWCWLVAGGIVGASTVNKLLVAVLTIGIAVGLAAFGPRRWFATGWLWAGTSLALLLALPGIVYQATHGWPQLAMGAALSEENADEVRVLMWPFLVVLVGPVLAVFWITALIFLFRRPSWRPLRFLVGVFAVVLVFVFVGGSQFYYTAGVLAVLAALGAVPVAEWARSRRRRLLVGIALGLNAAVNAVVSLPLLPVETFGASVIDELNQAAADQVGWEPYAAQVSAVAASADADVIIASNYGEAGALDRFGVDLPPVVSGHNALWERGRPPADAEVVVIVGGQASRAPTVFETCDVVAALDNGVGVGNEEQGVAISVCRGPIQPWDALWERFRHLS